MSHYDFEDVVWRGSFSNVVSYYILYFEAFFMKDGGQDYWNVNALLLVCPANSRPHKRS